MCSRTRCIQSDECLAGADGIALPDQDFTNDATLEMLDGAAIQIDDEGPGSHGSTVDLGDDTPTNDSAA